MGITFGRLQASSFEQFGLGICVVLGSVLISIVAAAAMVAARGSGTPRMQKTISGV